MALLSIAFDPSAWPLANQQIWLDPVKQDKFIFTPFSSNKKHYLLVAFDIWNTVVFGVLEWNLNQGVISAGELELR